MKWAPQPMRRDIFNHRSEFISGNKSSKQTRRRRGVGPGRGGGAARKGSLLAAVAL